MDEEKAIQYLKKFRKVIDEYLFLGYSPVSHPFSQGNKKMQKALENYEYQQLRETVISMESKALEILEECGMPRYSLGPVPLTHCDFKLTAFEPVWRNYSFGDVDKKVFFDIIDKAIDILEKRLAQGVLTVVTLDYTQEVEAAVNQLADDKGFTVHVVTPRPDIVNTINRSEFFIIDVSQTDNDIWFCAGYLQRAGKLPVFIAQQGSMITSSFVDMEYPVIFFEDKYDLWRKLSERIHMLRKKDIDKDSIQHK